MIRWLSILALLLFGSVAGAVVTPEEMLDDPVLEARARAIGLQVRCPQCQGEAIEESRAQISQTLRALVRERLLAGDSDEEVIDYIAARYGEGVRLKPKAEGLGLVLWAVGPILLILGGAAAVALFRKGGKPDEAATDTLTDEERARLGTLTGKGD